MFLHRLRAEGRDCHRFTLKMEICLIFYNNTSKIYLKSPHNIIISNKTLKKMLGNLHNTSQMSPKIIRRIVVVILNALTKKFHSPTSKVNPNFATLPLTSFSQVFLARTSRESAAPSNLINIAATTRALFSGSSPRLRARACTRACARGNPRMKLLSGERERVEGTSLPSLGKTDIWGSACIIWPRLRGPLPACLPACASRIS